MGFPYYGPQGLEEREERRVLEQLRLQDVRNRQLMVNNLNNRIANLTSIYKNGNARYNLFLNEGHKWNTDDFGDFTKLLRRNINALHDRVDELENNGAGLRRRTNKKSKK